MPDPGGSGLPRVAVAQVPSSLGQVSDNVTATVRQMRIAAEQKADLTVFPECTLSGYMFRTRDEVAAAAVAIDDPRLRPLLTEAAETDTYHVVGLLERDGDRVYNSAILLGPNGIEGRYRKQHLPSLGADAFVDAGNGDEDRVFTVGSFKVGIMICFDLRFPESARELALGGADVIAMPTNWPTTATFLAEHMTRVRAVENLVYLAVSDRSDSEAGAAFLGRSQIVAPDGSVLLDAGVDDGIFTAEVDVSHSRTKQLVLTDPPHSLPVFKGRRPELYSALTRPNQHSE